MGLVWPFPHLQNSRLELSSQGPRESHDELTGIEMELELVTREEATGELIRAGFSGLSTAITYCP